ncbi:exonuclease SbcCD, D subunit [Enterococcus moraviensis ATCC BAA-383]|uniref:Nuclease SbcCD subunit D n=1 Tax=Enterococcus moraviensis ATCC BAA-383 TaxID=1158609 RepID=R2QUI7_9ENTE|nr:exonuclease SbcCD subunit D [Enterococcus moraviensis]EOH98963.1 exonuclease SbcCD, D subunit [Enterococcus moraviensis ATCC BAA-383]EOT71862.1 exonuclease SbcD [Enterococcus moraviensis ATCC BAA-383]OJG67980.1 exonuclease SbcCD, D subunit [Enterococcus moraviensis]
MRFLHTADWHIGKKLHGYDLLEEQVDAFQQILAIAKNEEVDAIVVAGDLYDRSVPSVEAIEVFNQMIVEMNLQEKFPVLAISGNHDSSTRLETGGPWFVQSDFHLNTRLDQAFQPVEMGNTQFFLLPYFEPISARLFFDNEEIRTIEQAMQEVIKKMKEQFKPDMAHVLVSHFFVAGSEKSDSETKLMVGGLDTVPLSLLESFDYVALGHLHGKNALQAENARYSGSPLKFSLSEMNQKKGVWIVDTQPSETTFEFKELTPLRDVKQIEGGFKELTSQTFYDSINRENYLHIQLTDRAVIPNMMNQLRKIYPRVIGVERLFGREERQKQTETKKEVKTLAPVELVDQFFSEVTGESLTQQQQRWIEENLGAIHQAERGK